MSAGRILISRDQPNPWRSFTAAGGSPTSKKTSAERASSVEPKTAKKRSVLGEKPVIVGVSRSRTVDNIEHARTFGSQDSNNSVPASDRSDPARPKPPAGQPKAASSSPVPARQTKGGPDERRTEKVSCEMSHPCLLDSSGEGGGGEVL